MDFELTDRQQQLRDTARSFTDDKLIPLERELLKRGLWSKNAALTPQEEATLHKEAEKYGLWGLSTPAELGGQGVTNLERAIVEVELGRSFVWLTPAGETDNILYHCNEEQRNRYLLPTLSGDRLACVAITEPQSGSDMAGASTRAISTDSGWTLNGEKIFISRGNEADFAVVMAVTDPEEPPQSRFTLFLVDRSCGYEAEPIETMGSNRPALLRFEDVSIDTNTILGDRGHGWDLAMSWIARGRYLIPARAVGAATRLIELGLDHARERVVFDKPIGQNQAISWMLADSEVELNAAKWLTYRAAWTVDDGRDARHHSAIAKLHATQMVNNVVDRVMQIFGGAGYRSDSPVQQWYRDVRLWRIFEGTDEMQRLIIARDLIRGFTSIH